MIIQDAIFKRKSIRKYKMDGLNDAALNKVEEILKNVKPLYKDIDYKGHLVKDGMKVQVLFKNFISKYIKVKSPHYIIITSEKKEGYLENVGFAFEEIVLQLTCMGIGTCWIGAPFDRKMVKDMIQIDDNHEPVLLISLGEPEDFFSMYVNDISEYKRKPFEKVVSGELDPIFEDVFHYVRVAPSATNSQPWIYQKEEGEIKAFCIERKNKLTKAIYNQLNLIDMGISLFHLKVGLEKHNMNFDLIKSPEGKMKAHKYINTIKY
ncbi:nitroreductase family protein [Oceanirhabdus sp. W0125-5]|uniref:nitroreductase family protein n=1 Tax=Oceanirhabdus sp. W0125-5 TaxID=2999116 RepID=UPI0022F3321A|nr:nitroreductase family protein [Oceanirhabdus sp. W0125-5]WBW97458.1 nitroreductase family protein [Oceanirhabdus sp. W0125-5]